MIRRPPRSTPLYSSAASDVYKRQVRLRPCGGLFFTAHTVRGSPLKFVAPANDRRTCSQFFLIFGLRGLPLGPRSPKEEMSYYPPSSTILQNFSPIAQTVFEICVTKVFHFLAPGGLTPGPKFTKRGYDLADYEIYHPAKFHRSTPTHARDIPYKKSCGHTKNDKQTVTDISTTCLLYTSPSPRD